MTSKITRISYAHLSKSDWEQIISEWKNSKKSQRKYCQENNITIGAFSYWKSNLQRSKRQKTEPSEKPEFVKINIIRDGNKTPLSYNKSTCCPIELRFSNGGTVRISNNVDKDLLKLILQTMGSKPL